MRFSKKSSDSSAAGAEEVTAYSDAAWAEEVAAYSDAAGAARAEESSAPVIPSFNFKIDINNSNIIAKIVYAYILKELSLKTLLLICCSAIKYL